MARTFINVKYIALVNLICNKEVVKELIQNDFNVNSLVQELRKILNKKYRKQIFKDYENIINLLGDVGASKRAAKAIFSLGK